MNKNKKRKYRKCPKCKHKLRGKDLLYVEKEYTTSIKMEMNLEGKLKETIDGLTSGYSLADEFVNNMLVESDKNPEILGCEHCI